MNFSIEIHTTAIRDSTWIWWIFIDFHGSRGDDRSQTSENHSKTLLVWFVITQNQFGMHTGSKSDKIKDFSKRVHLAFWVFSTIPSPTVTGAGDQGVVSKTDWDQSAAGDF